MEGKMSNQAKSDAGALSGIRMSNTPSAIRQPPPDLGAEIKACERAGRAGQEAIRIGISTAAW
jgi:hypothetical protein